MMLSEYKEKFSSCTCIGKGGQKTVYKVDDTLNNCNYDATKERFAFLLDNSEHKIREYATKGFRSQNRDFGVGIEALRIAAASIDEDYGLRLRLDWARL